MLRLDGLRAEINGEFFLQEELKNHDVKKVEVLADIVIKPAGKKDMAKLLRMLENSVYPHVVINSKGRIVFPDKRFHGAVIVID